MVDDPSALPSTTASLEPGPASTAWRKPSLRSSMTVMVAKMALKSTTIVTTPGKKNCW
ncbi:hypothetical protein COSO111634_37625 [Corallococcus soli]